ncbi:bifunctional C-CAP-cofactor C-like domain/Tubulin binding cofactor C-like domain/Tubulin-specific chaperone C/Cyclase-associated protein CAP-septum formation inhibitor MinC [Babesia duncani]|uniref:Bifunctional C-CAP-cofactor C-like domain/Tubulin binding cofactor C-like domain/Tubulin-specific chaperone C/Cyclase-associated protein CAP-septum formation inhibitor MinC n=1 Tax=Babesia duncani TaxID=323732 RepID=A0AAD9PNS6_9APIC|nr:bifunctional C-CAP-cofactor C-like domain/Tubulin binding cofactor C-like domain/Tubulin-specific chaperone C/Cyclase-associated protein CAP-septum formation inhibitor MinC [Babesia duncani]
MENYLGGYETVEEADNLLKAASHIKSESEAKELVDKIKSCIKELLTISYPGPPNAAIYKTLNKALKVACSFGMEASPKPFSFKLGETNNTFVPTISKDNVETKDSVMVSGMDANETENVEPIIILEGGNITIRKQTNQRIVRTEEDLINIGSVIIENVTNCKILLLGIAQSVYIKNVIDCTIWVAIVNNSVILNTMSNSTLVTCSRQLRIGRCTGSKFYVNSTTPPIIESQYLNQLELCGMSQLLNDDKIKVIDFSWRKPGASTNWSSVPSKSVVNINTMEAEESQESTLDCSNNKTLVESDWEIINNL